jgi:hypothetical protein
MREAQYPTHENIQKFDQKESYSWQRSSKQIKTRIFTFPQNRFIQAKLSLCFIELNTTPLKSVGEVDNYRDNHDIF